MSDQEGETNKKDEENNPKGEEQTDVNNMETLPTEENINPEPVNDEDNSDSPNKYYHPPPSECDIEDVRRLAAEKFGVIERSVYSTKPNEKLLKFTVEDNKPTLSQMYSKYNEKYSLILTNS
ncbi:MAG: hypothetical protein MJ252_02340, partial [archaeon]|nr:hypothetical protein [archaeon]